MSPLKVIVQNLLVNREMDSHQIAEARKHGYHIITDEMLKKPDASIMLMGITGVTLFTPSAVTLILNQQPS